MTVRNLSTENLKREEKKHIVLFFFNMWSALVVVTRSRSTQGRTYKEFLGGGGLRGGRALWDNDFVIFESMRTSRLPETAKVLLTT
jgi:hypothetical protein